MMHVRVEEFLQKEKLHASAIDLASLSDDVCHDMQAGLKPCGKSHMPMLPTFLALAGEVPIAEPAIVIDAGGSFVRVALVQLNPDFSLKVEHFKKFPLPGAHYPISKQDFYAGLAQEVLPLISYSRKIAFCFSFHCSYLPSHDARVEKMGKEVSVEDIEHSLVGESLRSALHDLGNTKKLNIVVLNDTTAGLLAAYLRSTERDYAGYASLVLGTGFNTAYAEKIENIHSVTESELDKYAQVREGKPQCDQMLINMESGSFALPLEAEVDKILDRKSQNPGSCLLEKRTAGRYLGPQAYYTIERALNTSDLFSRKFCEGFVRLPHINSQDLDEFLSQSHADNRLSRICATEDDREVLFYLGDNVLERAAKYVVAVLAAIHKQVAVKTTPEHPLALHVEGSTYLKSKSYRQKIHYYTHKFLEDELGYYQDFIHLEQANLVGSALASYFN